MVTSDSKLDISVLIATYNRAEILRQTLENMTSLDRNGLSVEFIVIDNNSSDHTKEVIESFTDKLPIHYLFEPRPGKNCALNKALNEVPLGSMVVFTDDDVEPKKDWLKAIIAITNRWPGYSVFGGKIYPVWPAIDIPKWALDRHVIALAFASHDRGDSEHVYEPMDWPFGANIWVLRGVFSDKLRFNETIGPRPKDRIMGSETSFLKLLKDDGYEVVYSPFAVVGHCIQPCQISISNVLRRAYRCGRQGPNIIGLCRRELFQKNPMFWFLIRVGSTIKASFGYLVGMVCFSYPRGFEMRITSLIALGYNTESIRIALREIRKSFNLPHKN
jgi:glycosyltransferase involved in cell wall biosynthesis